MTAFIDAHRADYGVEPICKVLPIAPLMGELEGLGPGLHRLCARRAGAGWRHSRRHIEAAGRATGHAAPGSVTQTEQPPETPGSSVSGDQHLGSIGPIGSRDRKMAVHFQRIIPIMPARSKGRRNEASEKSVDGARIRRLSVALHHSEILYLSSVWCGVEQSGSSSGS